MGTTIVYWGYVGVILGLRLYLGLTWDTTCCSQQGTENQIEEQIEKKVDKQMEHDMQIGRYIIGIYNMVIRVGGSLAGCW